MKYRKYMKQKPQQKQNKNKKKNPKNKKQKQKKSIIESSFTHYLLLTSYEQTQEPQEKNTNSLGRNT